MFSNGKTHINVKTVGQAIEELKRLPPEMPMDQGYDGNGSDIVIFNEDTDVHVQFAEGGEWDEDAELGDDGDDEETD